MANGLAATSNKETTNAPTMYREIEQEENVARGCVELIEIIPYEATKEARRHPPEKDQQKGEIMKDRDGNTLYVEIGYAPYFCQETEQAMTYSENNPNMRTETFTVQVRKRTAIKYLDSPRNMKQFKEAN